MNRYRFLPVILLAGSLLVLLVMFFVRMFSANRQISQASLTLTAAAGEIKTEVIPTNAPTVSPQPSETPTQEPTSTENLPTIIMPPTATDGIEIESPEGCDVAAFLVDVTIPDGTEFDPETKFTKTWRLQNDGTCTWNNKYKLYFYSGDKMSGPESQRLVTIPIPPGKSIDISVVLFAPKEPGTYKGNWALKNANGVHFGLGPLNKPFYVKILVVGPSVAPTDTPTP